MIKEIHGGNIYKYDHKVYDFSANLNPLGMPAEAKQAITAHLDEYESYPDPDNRELTAEISRFHGVAGDKVCCGNGAADIIFRIALAMKPAHAMIISPTFAEYEQALDMTGCRTAHYLLKEEDGFVIQKDVLNHINDHLDMMFLCNPNNPTGIPIPKETVMAIAAACREKGVLLVIDECFSEFLDDEERYSLMGEIAALEHVIILKAFTKIYAMAGLRLGYCVCGSAEIADQISGCLQPWPVSTAASKAGVAAMKIPGFIEKTRAYVKENREILIDGLNRLGYRTYGSKANYIFFRSEENLTEPLEAYDIMIRSCANYLTLDGRYYRIAVRTREENQYFLKALEAITEKNKEKRNG